jgi:hypothetical protein
VEETLHDQTHPLHRQHEVADRGFGRRRTKSHRRARLHIGRRLVELARFLLGWLGAFLIVLAIFTVFGEQLEAMSLRLRALLMSGALITAMNFLVMPALTRFLALFSLARAALGRRASDEARAWASRTRLRHRAVGGDPGPWPDANRHDGVWGGCEGASTGGLATMTTLHDPGTCSLRPAEARDAPGVVSSSRPRTSSLVERNGFWPRPMTEDYDELIDMRHVTVAERGEAIEGPRVQCTPGLRATQEIRTVCNPSRSRQRPRAARNVDGGDGPSWAQGISVGDGLTWSAV